MPGVRLIALWMVICCTCCPGGSLAMERLSSNADQSSTASSATASQAASSTQQQSSAGAALDINPNSSFLTRRQLAELKRSITRVREDMRTVESALLDSSLSRDQLISLQRKATKRLQLLDRRISKYLRQAANLEKVNAEKPTEQPTEHSPNDLDQIDQQLSSTNQIKATQDPKFFFSSSSSSSSSSVARPHFWHVDASASTNRNSSSNGFGSSSSSSNRSPDPSASISSDSLPSNSFNSISANSISTNSSGPLLSDNSSKIVNSSTIIVPGANGTSYSSVINHLAMHTGSQSNYQSNDQLAGKLSDKLGDNVNGTSEKPGQSLDKVRIKSKIDRFVGGFIGGLNNLINHRTKSTYDVTNNVKQEKHPFLLYHKCSEGYLQLSANGTLSTGMDANLLAKSEFIFQYLPTKAQNRLQIQTPDDRYLCFNAQGRPEIMASLNEPMCTFQIIYHKKEYIQLVSVWNSTWTLGFSRRGIPIRARASHKRKGKRKTSAPNACTLFLRQRSDEQLLQRLADLSRDQQEYRQKISAHNAQIKKIEMGNSPLAQDSLIMAKIERLRRKQDGQAT